MPDLVSADRSSHMQVIAGRVLGRLQAPQFPQGTMHHTIAAVSSHFKALAFYYKTLTNEQMPLLIAKLCKAARFYRQSPSAKPYPRADVYRTVTLV